MLFRLGTVSRLKHELSLGTKSSPVVPTGTKEKEKRKSSISQPPKTSDSNRAADSNRTPDSNRTDESRIMQIKEDYEVRRYLPKAFRR